MLRNIYFILCLDILRSIPLIYQYLKISFVDLIVLVIFFKLYEIFVEKFNRLCNNLSILMQYLNKNVNMTIPIL